MCHGFVERRLRQADRHRGQRQALDLEGLHDLVEAAPDLAEPPPLADFPEGVNVRTYTDDDAEDVHRLLDEAYLGWDDEYVDMPHDVTVIKGRRFPTCRHCKGVSFKLAHAAKHVSEIDHFEEAHAPAK